MCGVGVCRGGSLFKLKVEVIIDPLAPVRGGTATAHVPRTPLPPMGSSCNAVTVNLTAGILSAKARGADLSM